MGNRSIGNVPYLVFIGIIGSILLISVLSTVLASPQAHENQERKVEQDITEKDTLSMSSYDIHLYVWDKATAELRGQYI